MKTYVIEEKGTFRGFDYMIKLLCRGHRCGYVKLDKWLTESGRKSLAAFMDDHTWLDCHGGVSFIEKIRDREDFDDGCWVGFDCAHVYDKPDVEAVKKAFGDTSTVWAAGGYTEDATVKTLDFVRSECFKIIEQLQEFEYKVKKPLIEKAACCAHCKYYESELGQPWQDGFDGMLCRKHNKSTEETDCCKEFMRRE